MCIPRSTALPWPSIAIADRFVIGRIFGKTNVEPNAAPRRWHQTRRDGSLLPIWALPRPQSHAREYGAPNATEASVGEGEVNLG
jgi:hypothetical protein